MQHLTEQAPAAQDFPGAVRWTLRHLAVGTSVFFWGPPGIGKSAICRQIADLAGRTLVILIGSTCEPTDFGFPVIDTLTIKGEEITRLKRVPIDEIARCTEPGRMLFLDEFTGVPPSVQQPLLRLALEKVVGSIALHPDTWIVAAANQPEYAPDAQEIRAAMGNRFAQVELAPTLQDVCRYLADLGEPGSALRDAALDWIGTAQAEPAILQLTPPDESIQCGAPWASPRAVEMGVRVLAVSRTEGDEEDFQHSLLTGVWGEKVAGLFMGVMKYRTHLPTVDEMVADPEACKLPEQPQYQVAAIGLLTRAAQRDAHAAWIYAARLRPELRMAATRALMGAVKTMPKKSKHLKAGKKAKQRLIAETGRNLAGSLAGGAA